MIAFVDDHRGDYGVEPICKVLPIAQSTYYDHVAKRLDPSRLSGRAKRDEVMKVEVHRVFEENFRVYGVRKVWGQLQREGFDVACAALISSETIPMAAGQKPGTMRSPRDGTPVPGS